ncbi:MAG TPA: gephyrin-like molybdotransferase Glp [Pyrinomonadaceae bacterium]|nr:gephyrin-like molybdotransferase Glp [Pyrinomonadaceae bacterium]
MIPVAEAIQIVIEQTPTLPPETVSLADASGRFLAEDVLADSDLPPFDRSQMDGYAVRAADTENAPVSLRIVGESAAGNGWHQEMNSGEAVRIMTGAPLPAGADSVQQVELTQDLSPELVEIQQTVSLGRSIVARGSEVKRGTIVLNAGEQITPAALATLASFGYAQVKVGKRPRVAVLATGSELVAVDQLPGLDQIRDSNNYSIGSYAALAGAQLERLQLTGDDINLLKQQIAEAASRSDVVITSGGVSMGVYDFTKAALKELGCKIFFERVALRPGKPTVFAQLPNGTLVFGLPGNPVSVSVTFNLFARAALLRMQGANDPSLHEQRAILARDVKGAAERESYLPAAMRTDDQGHSLAEPLKWGGSSDFVAFTRATALIILAAGPEKHLAGTVVRVVTLPY